MYQVTQSTALQAEYGVYRLPGTPPSSVYQVTHGTALQAAERYVMQRVLRDSIRGLPHARQNGLFLFIALARMVTFCKEGGDMISVWALRARSYKTRAEA